MNNENGEFFIYKDNKEVFAFINGGDIGRVFDLVIPLLTKIKIWMSKEN